MSQRGAVFFHGGTNVQSSVRGDSIFSNMFLSGLMNHLPHHSQTAFAAQKGSSWATFKLFLGYLSSLVARNYQYSEIIEMGVQIL